MDFLKTLAVKTHNFLDSTGFHLIVNNSIVSLTISTLLKMHKEVEEKKSLALVFCILPSIQWITMGIFGTSLIMAFC